MTKDLNEILKDMAEPTYYTTPTVYPLIFDWTPTEAIINPPFSVNTN